VERHSTSQVLFVWAQTLSVSCSSGTWRISYLQCTLPRPLLRFFLLLSNGRRLGGGPLSRGLAQDGYQSSLEPRSHMYSSISTLAKLYVMVPGDGRRVAGTLQNHIGDRSHIAIRRPSPLAIPQSSYQSTFSNRCRTPITVPKVGNTSSSRWTALSPSSSSTVRSSTQPRHFRQQRSAG